MLEQIRQAEEEEERLAKEAQEKRLMQEALAEQERAEQAEKLR